MRTSANSHEYGGSEGEAFAAVTLDELVQLIDAEIDRGYEQTDMQKGRRRLRTVVQELARSPVAGADHLLTGEPWRIAHVRVAGVGGIETLSPQPLEFTPAAGLTIVRGPNGHGKTSLSRAIACGLRGDREVAREHTSVLWASELLTDGLHTAAVEVSLIRGSDQLSVRAEFAASGSEEVTATLLDAAGARAVVLGDGWREALSGARACYSYGALQNRLRDDRELQGYLEELLVLGPVWTQVRDAITERSNRASVAKKAVEAARKSAVQQEQALAARFGADDRAPEQPPSVTWPPVKEAVDVEDWLRRTGLASAEVPCAARVAKDHEERVRGFDEALRAADTALAEAERTLDAAGMAAALHHVEKLVSVDDLDPATCPVCGTETDWQNHARDLVAGVRGRAAAAERVRAVISSLATWIEKELGPLFDAGVPGGPEGEVSAFRTAVAEGHHAHSAVHHSARTLLVAMTGDAHHVWLARLRAASDATAEWRAALSALVVAHAAVLREHGSDAAEAAAWVKAQGALDALQVEFRQRRQDAVTGLMHAALGRMLPDADIDLTTIRHPGGVKQQRRVEVGLTIGGREARLGMLSDGQRNALLLTPLVTLDALGPFGFLIVDDPVHALDDMRVDVLAQELTRLAYRRQVIVMTHDPRLEEHLRSRHPGLAVIELHRDPRSRTVEWTRYSTPWDALLDDARGICASASSDGWVYSESLESVVAGLCRDAVDGALRQAVMTCAVHRGRVVQDALTTLGEARDTRRRIKHVVDLAGGAGTLPGLERGRDQHLDFWNKGSHGQLPDGVDLPATITAAQEACAEVTAFDWSKP